MEKKLIVLCSVLAMIILSVGMVSAQDLYPRVEGNDVLVPVYVIQQGGLNESAPIYAATDVNGWFVRGEAWANDTIKATTLMVKEEGGMYRARGMAGQRFHPVNLDKDGKPVWLKIEDVYSLPDSKFVDNKTKSPCFLVR